MENGIQVNASIDEQSYLPCTMNPEHLQLLVTRTMPYGKYKGRLIADLPGHYGYQGLFLQCSMAYGHAADIVDRARGAHNTYHFLLPFWSTEGGR